MLKTAFPHKLDNHSGLSRSLLFLLNGAVPGSLSLSQPTRCQHLLCDHGPRGLTRRSQFPHFGPGSSSGASWSLSCDLSASRHWMACFWMIPDSWLGFEHWLPFTFRKWPFLCVQVVLPTHSPDAPLPVCSWVHRGLSASLGRAGLRLCLSTVGFCRYRDCQQSFLQEHHSI